MNEAVENILDTVLVGAMATVDENGSPRVSPVHFARLEDSIIWMSSRASHHADNAIRDGRLDFVAWNDQKQGVFLYTAARVLPEERLEEAYEAIVKKHGSVRPKSGDLEIYISPIGQIDENSTTQDVWHFIA